MPSVGEGIAAFGGVGHSWAGISSIGLSLLVHFSHVQARGHFSSSMHLLFTLTVFELFYRSCVNKMN
jgi:hypothetical protein